MAVENNQSENWQDTWNDLTRDQKLVCWNSGILPLGAVVEALHKCGIPDSVLEELSQKGLVKIGSLSEFAQEIPTNNYNGVTNNTQPRYKIANSNFARFISSQRHPLSQ